LSVRIIKCVVWDLDRTLWHGVAAESDDVGLNPGVRAAVTALDAAGVLQSVASRGDEELALAALGRLGMADYLLFPQINWGDKDKSLIRIAEKLNLGLDSLVLVDDDPYERGQVAAALPQVETIAPDELGALVAKVGRQPTTPEAGNRRALYQVEHSRSEAERRSGLSPQAWADQLGLEFTVRQLRSEDLERARELTVRTHQLNTTGITYSAGELRRLRGDPDHLVLAASLRDRFGDYGTIGLAVVQTTSDVWILTLLLTSCRVVSRGAGSLLLGDVQRRAAAAGARLEAEMVPTERNRMMTVALRLAGFQTSTDRRHGHLVLLAPATPPQPPRHVTVRSEP